MLRSLLEFAPRKDQELVSSLASRRNSHIWIFGAAGIGISVKRWLTGQNFAVYAFCDNNPNKVGTVVDGIPVRSFSELCQDHDKVVLLAVWKYFQEMAAQCVNAGIPFEDAALLSGVVFDCMEESAAFVASNLPKISSICQKLQDKTSHEIYLASQAARIFRERNTMRRYRFPTQYIEPDIAPLGPKETVFICGAGNGAAANDVDKITNGAAQLHLFEPDPENFSNLCGAMAHRSNVRCIERGVGHRSERLPFSGGMGENATFSLPGNGTAPVIAIDEYVKDTGDIPTFLTMDIEGWELNALYGAEKTIVTHKPKLAISLYHRASDFVNIPEFVWKLRPDYRLYVRHYTDSYSDTVAYFV